MAGRVLITAILNHLKTNIRGVEIDFRLKRMEKLIVIRNISIVKIKNIRRK
jgi:hypothetical protein